MDTQTILTIANHVITKNHRIGVTHTEHKTWHLHIRDVRQNDRGNYMCQINTDPMKSQIGYLEVVGSSIVGPPFHTRQINIARQKSAGCVSIKKLSVSPFFFFQIRVQLFHES